MAARLEDYAMIGDGRTAALVCRDGTIDGLCLPRFDRNACCAALLGTRDIGAWQIAPAAEIVDTSRAYVADSLVLQTTFETSAGVIRLTDFMPTSTDSPHVVRIVTGISGTVPVRCAVALRFDYGSVPPRIRQEKDGFHLIAGPDLVVVRAPEGLGQKDNCLEGEFTVAAGQHLEFVLSYGLSYRPAPSPGSIATLLEATLEFWNKWAGQFRRETRWRDAVVRSLVTLKGLIYWPSGGLAAAATTSLPEAPGGKLNWDYRYCWLRDATFTVSALLNAGYHDEATAWRDWMLRAIGASPREMRIMYRVDGGRRIDEWQVEWLTGYEGADPVRVGNSAAAQRQIDVVGELLDALDLISRAGVPVTDESQKTARDLIAHLEATWHAKGHGLWESRGEPQFYTYPKVMAWAGLDRFIRADATPHIVDPSGLQRLSALRERIRQEVMTNAWNHARGCFVDRYGGQHPDASLLLLPLIGFLPADDPRMAATVTAIERDLTQDGLVWRTLENKNTRQGVFVAASCWLADCFAMQGHDEKAASIFESVLGLRNDVGLLSEEYHLGLRRLTGNFPQALSHLAVVNTALGLSGPVLQRGGG
jgi:GH15 family glucan-1,4-alpha-glucosidase